jgi:hypothetical protein
MELLLASFSGVPCLGSYNRDVMCIVYCLLTKKLLLTAGDKTKKDLI